MKPYTGTVVIKRAGAASVDGYFNPYPVQPHYGPQMSIQNPSGWLSMQATGAGVPVTELSALGSTAFYRGVSVIASTIATLPLKSYRTANDGARDQVPSVFDNPGAQFFTPFEWVELVMVHLVIHGNAYLLHLYSPSGTLVGFFPLHPLLVQPEWVCDKDGKIVGKRFKTNVGGQDTYHDETQMTQIMGLGCDGLRGLSVITVARDAIGTGLAGDKAAARMFASGMLVGGLVTTDDESLTKEDGQALIADLKARLTGSNNAGDIALVNASLKFSPWTMSAEDAQFLESRQYQVEEISRLLGVPKVLLAEDGASSWGTGIGQLLSYMQKTTLVPWTERFQQRLSRLLAAPRHVEFDYAGLLRGTPMEQTQLLAAQLDAGIIDVEEARASLNLPPKTPAPAGDATWTPPLPATQDK
jgi:HK97 family phage portal protein